MPTRIDETYRALCENLWRVSTQMAAVAESSQETDEGITMSKYCIYWDRPAGFDLDGDTLGGCTIFGVHHDCAKCPNLIEMGEGSITYNEQKTKGE